jgi:predicted ArsR family transcriptional regulator
MASEKSSWVDRWKEHASAFDRVTSVTMTLTSPQPASWIATEAAVAPNTARDHLRRLTELGVVMLTADDGTRHYQPDPLYERLRDVRELVREQTASELVDAAVTLKDDIAGWATPYDAASPEALRASAETGDISAEEAHERIRVASDWELARHRLGLIQEALEHYDTWSAAPSRGTD